MNRQKNSNHRGQTLVEFAIILPVFLFLIVVIFDFGRAVYYYSAIHNAAREGARYGVIHPDDSSDIAARAKNYAIGLGVSDITVTTDITGTELVGTFQNPTIKVTVSYPFTPVTPLVSAILPCGCNYITLTSDAVMRTETLP